MVREEKIPQSFNGKSVVVMGLGLHGGGVAATNWLTKHGARVLVTDKRTRSILRPSLEKLRHRSGITAVLGKHRMGDFRRADLVVQNPGVPANSPYLAEAKKNGIPVVNEAAIFFARCPCPIIGITGTKGKSTTSALTHELLKKKYGRRVVLAGNIRTTAMLDILDGLKPSSIVVLELSSWQLEGLPTVKKSPHIAVVTNLLDDHLDRYASRTSYFAAKSLIWRWQKKDDVVLLNWDNAPSLRWKGKPKSEEQWFSAKSFNHSTSAGVRNGWMVQRKGKKVIGIVQEEAIALRGAHALSAVVPAVQIALLHRVPLTAVRSVLRTFKGLPGRLEPVGIIAGVTFINDTTATTPVATQSALESFKRKIILIAGGMNKKTPYSALARSIKKKVKTLVLLPGTGSDELVRLLRGWKHIHPATSMKRAVAVSFRIAQRGDAVVLSPAGSSLNLFRHEFDRGEQFDRAVRSLKKQS